MPRELAARFVQCAGVGVLSAFMIPSTAAQKWEFIPSVALQETLTNNVNISPSPTQSDLVTVITPTLAFHEKGQRTKLDGSVSVPIAVYARTGAVNNQAYPSASILGDIALIESFFHVEGTVSIAQQFYTPFGPQPPNFDTATANRYRTETYGVNPYISGSTPDGTTYELRNNNVWTNLASTPVEVSNARYTEVVAKVANTERTVGWRAIYDYTNTQFYDQNPIRTQLGRVVSVYRADPELLLEASVGYESNQYSLTSSKDTIYGAGLEWSPTERTRITGKYEHRFFGGSYLLSFTNRTPLSSWSVRASRNVTTYPQQLATVPAGFDVASFLNNLFLSSIPDPAARQQAVDQLILSRGLPASLASPVNLYAQQILLQESQYASFALIGARNTIAFNAYNIRSEQITAAGSPIPPALGMNNNNNTQTGGGIVWTNRLTEAVNLVSSLDAYRTVANSPNTGSTRQVIAQVMLSTPLSPFTSVFAGGRFQTLQSEFTADYSEAAAIVGFNHTFR